MIKKFGNIFGKCVEKQNKVIEESLKAHMDILLESLRGMIGVAIEATRENFESKSDTSDAERGLYVPDLNDVDLGTVEN